MAGDQYSWSAVVGATVPFTEARACNCIGPQRGDPVCPCMMPAHIEREAGRRALEFMRGQAKPRFRVKAGRRVVADA